MSGEEKNVKHIKSDPCDDPNYRQIYRDNFYGVRKQQVNEIAGKKVSLELYFTSMGYVQNYVTKEIQKTAVSVIESDSNGFDLYIKKYNLTGESDVYSLPLTKRILIEIVQDVIPDFFRNVDKKEYKIHIEKFRIILYHLVNKHLKNYFSMD